MGFWLDRHNVILTIAATLASLALAGASVGLGAELVIGAGDRIGGVWLGACVVGMGIVQAVLRLRSVVTARW